MQIRTPMVPTEPDARMADPADDRIRRTLRRHVRLAALSLRADTAHAFLGTPERPSHATSYRASGTPPVPPAPIDLHTQSAAGVNGAPSTTLGVEIPGKAGAAGGCLWVVRTEARRWSRRERRLLSEIAELTGEDLALRATLKPAAAPTAADPPLVDTDTLTVGDLLLSGVADAESLASALRDGVLGAVHEGRAEAGTRLPSIREIAERTGATRYAVLQAYRTLESQGIVETRHRSGIYVAGMGESAVPHLPETAGWLGRVITESYLHQVKLPTLPGLIERWTASTTIRCACLESSEDYRYALAEEIRSQFGLETIEVPLPREGLEGRAAPPFDRETEAQLAAADLVVTTPFHAPAVGPVAARLGIPLVVATRDAESASAIPDAVGGGEPLVVVCLDPAFGARILNRLPAAEQSAIRIVSLEDGRALAALDRSRPVLMTGAAKARLTGEDFRLRAAHFPSFSRRFAERLARLVLQINLRELRRAPVASALR